MLLFSEFTKVTMIPYAKSFGDSFVQGKVESVDLVRKNKVFSSNKYLFKTNDFLNKKYKYKFH